MLADFFCFPIADTFDRSNFFKNLKKFYQEVLFSDHRKIVIGRQGRRTEFCLSGPRARTECPFCKRVLADQTTLMIHLICTRRNNNLRVVKNPAIYPEPKFTPNVSTSYERAGGSARQQGL